MKFHHSMPKILTTIEKLLSTVMSKSNLLIEITLLSSLGSPLFTVQSTQAFSFTAPKNANTNQK